MSSPSQITLVFDSEENLQSLKNKKNAITQKLRYVKDLVTIEPLLFCYLIALVITDPAVNNLQLEMACKTNSGYNNTVCEAVVTATHAEKNFTEQNSHVQQYISDMLSWSIPVQSIFPVILLLFFGSYSDRHKIRKPFLLLPIFGAIFATLCYIICAIFKDVWPVSSTGIVYAISSLFGGGDLIAMSAFAYVADISTKEMRLVRMSFVEIFIYLTAPIGLTFSGTLYDTVGYIPTLLIALCLHIMAFVYGILLVKEPKVKDTTQGNISFKDLIKDIVNPKHALSTIKLLTSSRGIQRVNIIFVVVILYIFATVIGGEFSVFFYFTQHAYGWNYSHYTLFLVVWTVFSALGLAIAAIVLSKILHLDDLIIIGMSFAGKIISNIIFITAKSAWQLYLGLFTGIFQEAGGAGIRSLSTKYVSEEDIGKSQSLLSITEAIAYAVAAEIYHQGIYTYTRDKYIQALFYLGIGLFSLGIILIMWKYLSNKKQLALNGEPQKGLEAKKTSS